MLPVRTPELKYRGVFPNGQPCSEYAMFNRLDFTELFIDVRKFYMSVHVNQHQHFRPDTMLFYFLRETSMNSIHSLNSLKIKGA